ncbi:secreted protein [Melampsora americana]|nr:secreted protein [Melampsora americana]
MLSLPIAFVLSLCTFLPSLTLADDHAPQSAHVYWRWKDQGNSNPTDQSIFTGHATITWTRNAGCESTGSNNYWRDIPSETPITVKGEVKNNSKDYLDPKSIYTWTHAKDSPHGNPGCNANARTDFWVYNRDRTQRMKIRLPDICTDKDCAGPDKERPNVQCLNGPKGRVVMYRDKWIDECFAR